MKQFIEIATDTYRSLESIAKKSGCTSVEELLTKFAVDFSTGCSVTLTRAKITAA